MTATATARPSLLADPFGAFCPVAMPPQPANTGPLAGLRFAVKDLFDVAGVPTGAGSPDWRRTHPIPTRSAPVVERLIGAGAALVGKTVTDELAYSLMGINDHDGTPINPAAPDRLPGGSSSGSAAAVAGGLVAFALGTDTGGSVRLPASFCGILGFRPSHGRLDMTGVVPLAPSFDTVGWFARDAATLTRVGRALGIEPAEQPRRLLIARDAANDACEPALAKLAQLFDRVAEIAIADEPSCVWREAFRICQAAEIWQTHGSWIERTQPQFGQAVAARFAAAARVSSAEIGEACSKRKRIRARLKALLDDDAVICLPTAPGPAPFRDADQATLGRFRNRAIELLCPAGLAGLPQVSLPLAIVDDAPLGLSFIAAAGRDGALLTLAGAAMDAASRA